MLNNVLKKSVLTIMIAANVASMTSLAYAGSKSSSRSSYSSSSSKSSSYSSSSRSSYTSSPSSSSYSSTSRSSYSSTPSSSSYSKTPSKTAVYTPVSKATPSKPLPYKQDPKKPNTAAYSGTTSKVSGQSYSAIKNSKPKKSSNFLSWVLLAWILSDSNKSSASTSTTKEVVVDCKQWLKDNAQKPSDLSSAEYQKIKKYCESITK
ncbi:hypothetical protein [Acinetobacter baumannii]|uniref:hypothetical protein n=1 Tax=Acinetobacter baumannii TaxID=470 RepID=UPI000DF2EB66|nr:hypothetical protein [Acinetobacter baumannii]RCT89646.1 hypothetical protein DVA68_15705 [Acinetobacter baumannii]